METTRLSSKGQVVLPKIIRDTEKWTAGTEFSVEKIPGGVALRPVPRIKATKIEDIIGFLKYKGPVKTIRQMDEGIMREARARHDRGRY